MISLFAKYLFSATLVVSQPGTDAYTYYLHAQTFIHDEIARGNMPTWNPYTYGGHPFLGDFQSALLYPPNWILRYLPAVTAINWWVALHVFIFGFCTYAWTAFRGMRPAAAFVAGTAAMLGGTFYMHVYAGHLSNLGSMAWAPLVFLGIDGWLRRKHAGYVFLAAVAAALQVYAGHPQYVYYTAIAAGVYSLLHIPYLESHLRKSVVGLIAIYPLAMLLSMAQLLPGYCTLSETVRSTGASFEFASMFGLPPENMLTFIAPWIYGGTTEVAYWGRCYLWEMQLFIGTGMLILAVYGFIGTDKVSRWRLAIMMLILLILALGARTPFYTVLYKCMPFYSSFRGTSKFIFLIGMFAAFLAGAGMNRLLSGELRLRAHFGVIVITLGVVLTLVGVLSGSAFSDIWQKTFATITSSSEIYFAKQLIQTQPNYESSALALAGRQMLFGGLWIIGFGGLLLFAQRNKLGSYVMGAVAIVNVWIFAFQATTGFEASAAKIPPLEKLMEDNKNAGDFRTLNTIMSSANMTWRREDIWGYDPTVLKRYAEYVYFSQGLNPDTASQTPPPWRKSPMLDILRCRYAFTTEGSNIRIVDMGDALTRFMIVSQYKIVTGRDNILKEVSSPLFRPRQEIILESEPIPVPDSAGAQYTVKLLGFSSDSWTLEIGCDKALLLVMTDAYAKGWTATALPGSVQSNYNVMPANYAMRAIPLAAGRHLLRLEYIQPGLATGVKTSLLATLALALLVFVPVFRRKLDFAEHNTYVENKTTQADIEIVNCAVCGSKPDKHVLVCEKEVPGGRVYKLVQCKQCGLAFISPRLTQEAILKTYQDSSYFQRGEGEITGYNDYTVDRELHTMFFRTQIDTLDKQIPGKGRLLDIGCAFGYLLDDARKRGWKVEGIELSGNAIRYAREEMKLTVHSQPLRDVAFPSNTFNAVVMDDVIEHYGDPAAEVREVARVLVKGGAFLLHTPNYDSPWRTLLGDKWVHLKPEEHLYYFSPSTLSELLRRNGFDVIYARARGKATNVAYILGVFNKFLPWFGRLLQKTVGRLPMARWAFSFRGGGMEVLAIKK